MSVALDTPAAQCRQPCPQNHPDMKISRRQELIELLRPRFTFGEVRQYMNGSPTQSYKLNRLDRRREEWSLFFW
jgi:hypothetical protein